jgi:hypothetical protein
MKMGWPGINNVTKYGFPQTIEKADWKNSVFLKRQILKSSKIRKVLTFKFMEVVS